MLGEDLAHRFEVPKTFAHPIRAQYFSIRVNTRCLRPRTDVSGSRFLSGLRFT